MKREYIIFCEEHYNPLGLIRSLGEAGIKPVAIIIKGEFSFASASRYIKKLHLVDSIEDGYKILIKEYGNKKCKSILYTSDDKITSYLDIHYSDLEEKFIFYNAGKNNRISYYMQKDNINNLAIKCGLNVAKNWTVNVGEIPKDLEFPIITKAIVSTIDNWKEDVFICNSIRELKEAYKKIRSKKVLLQKFISKKNELCLDGFSYNDGRNVQYCIASNYLNIKYDGYSNYMIVKNSDFPMLEEKLNKMFAEINFNGIFSVEFLIDENDVFYFLEINFRNSTWSYASTKAGMNLPILWANSMIDKKFNFNKIHFKEFKAMAEFVDFKDRVKTHEISIFKWLIQMINCKCLYFWNIRDPKPVIIRICHKIIKVLRRNNENR